MPGAYHNVALGRRARDLRRELIAVALRRIDRVAVQDHRRDRMLVTERARGELHRRSDCGIWAWQTDIHCPVNSSRACRRRSMAAGKQSYQGGEKPKIGLMHSDSPWGGLCQF